MLNYKTLVLKTIVLKDEKGTNPFRITILADKKTDNVH